MALDEWYPWNEATLSDPAPLEILLDAARERASVVAHELNVNLPYDRFFERPILFPHSIPALSVAEALREAIRALAPHFVRMDDASYAVHSWRNFPAMLSPTDEFDGSAGLSILPEPHVPELNEAGLAIYRTFLASCAAWLQRMRYVRADSLSVCSSALVDPDVGETSDTNELPTARLVAGLANVSFTTLATPRATIPRFSVSVSFSGSQYGGAENNSTTWNNKISQGRSVAGTMSGLADLSVANAAGINATCLLVPCGDDGRPYGRLILSSSRVVDPTIIYSSQSSPRHIYGAFGSGRQSESEEWRISESESLRVWTFYGFTSDENLTISSGTATWDRVTTEIEVAWSEDLQSHLVTRDDSNVTRCSQSVGSLGTPFQATMSAAASMEIADAMGLGTIGIPLQGVAIPAHETVTVMPQIESLAPDLSLLHAHFEVPDFSPCAYSSGFAGATYSVRLFPVLDYGPHFKYRPAQNTDS